VVGRVAVMEGPVCSPFLWGLRVILQGGGLLEERGEEEGRSDLGGGTTADLKIINILVRLYQGERTDITGREKRKKGALSPRAKSSGPRKTGMVIEIG